MSDLWRFNPDTGNWAWISGPQQTNVLDNFTTQGVDDPLAFPGCRYGAVGWTDRKGRLLLYGAQTYAPSTGLSRPAGDSLWRFDPATGNWTWLRDDHNAANYGARGVANPANTPGPFGGRGNACPDPLGRIWLQNFTALWFLDQPAYTGINAVSHRAWSDLN